MNHIREPDYSSTDVATAERGQTRPLDDLVDYLRDYARERPEMLALWAFGIGFVLGWRLKPW